jgi:hypothetical protein
MEVRAGGGPTTAAVVKTQIHEMKKKKPRQESPYAEQRV